MSADPDAFVSDGEPSVGCCGRQDERCCGKSAWRKSKRTGPADPSPVSARRRISQLSGPGLDRNIGCGLDFYKTRRAILRGHGAEEPFVGAGLGETVEGKDPPCNYVPKPRNTGAK